MDENNDVSLLDKLKKIKEEIKHSWYKDCDRTEYMIEFTKMLKEMASKDTLEDYFSNDEQTLTEFKGEILQEIIGNILIQPKIYGDNGEEIALNLLLNLFKLFLKFHKNSNYSTIFERIRYIFHQDHGSNSFFSNHRYEDDEKKYNYSNFNSQFCSEFEKKNENTFKIGDEVDFIIDNNNNSRSIVDRNSWVRGKIKDIQNDEYIIGYCEDSDINIPKNDYNLSKKNTKTLDWEWRTNLKQYDVIDCFDRNKWYPATILDVIEEEENNGYKKIKYKIGFRLYPDHFKNLEDENDTYDKHTDIWKNEYNSDDAQIKTDNNGEKYVGDMDNCNEDIIFHSKRIQKFNTYSAVQQKNIKYNYSPTYGYSNDEEENKQMKIMNDKLINDSNINIDEFYYYELNGKKNYIIGKNKDFYYYYARLLKMMENENAFSEFIEILKNEPNTEEIYNIFFILTYSFPYLHEDYFKENSGIIKDSLIKYINSLKEKEMRKLPNDLIELVSNLLYKINEYNENNEDKDKDNPANNDKKELMNTYDEITLTFSMKTIKTTIFDRRLQGIKTLNEFIEKNQNNKEILKKIIGLIKDNEIISEIFGSNYHSQIISRSNEIVKLLLLENELKEEDIKLIWSCTKRGDLEAKLTILKLLSELAPNLNENDIEMLLNNIRENVDKKNNKEEIELVYKLSTQGKNNEKNIEHCCDYLCQCLLISNDSNIKKTPILEKILEIIEKDKKYLKKIFDICENCIKNNEKTILSYSILFEVMDKLANEKIDIIDDFIKDEHLLKLFEDNYNLYIKQSKDLLKKNDITEPDIIDKYIIDGFTHLENVKKRMEVYPFLINKYYTSYDFLPFLKNVLIENAVSPNDQLIFYDFVKKYISDNDNINTDTIIRKEKIRKELFDLISESNPTEITVEQLKLFIALFFDMNNEKIKLKESNKYESNNKDMEYEIVDVVDIDELKGLDKLWNMIFQIKEEKVLTVAINIIFQIYNNKNIEKLLEKCNNLIKEENTPPETIDKCLILLKLIIIESEKNCLFKPKSHLSLLKNCLINLPLKIKEKKLKDDNEDIKKFLLVGNTNINDLKILISKLYNLPPQNISFAFTEKYLKFLKSNNLLEKEVIDESNNNNTLYELIVEKNNNLKSELKPNEKIIFDNKKIEPPILIINGEMNPKLKNIIKDWFKEFTENTLKMGPSEVVNFIKGVTNQRTHISENENRVKSFLRDNDKDKKGYINEEEFINFYKKALESGNEKTVLQNLKTMGIKEDLRKADETYEINFIDNEKLPRYKLGNDLTFIENLIQKYYKNPNSNSSLIDFLLYLTTNENIYNDILDNLFNNNEENKDKESFVNKAFKDNSNYVEQNYIFIIIESILQDLEVYLYNKYIQSNDFIIFNNSQYKIVSEKYEPFDNEEKIGKKLNFVKNLIKSENFQNIINQVNYLLEKLSKLDNNNLNVISKLIDNCLRGLRILNIINNFCSIEGKEKENINCLKELKEHGVYNLGFCNLS